MRRLFTRNIMHAATGIIATLLATPVFAHAGAHHAADSFSLGFLHPLSGWDHLLAMLAVGIWAAQQHHAAKWLLPLLFPAVMAVGAFLALAGLPAPMVEGGIVGSVLVLGLVAVFSVQAPVWAASSIVSLFAVMHGYAHGLEAPDGGAVGSYGAGVLAATVCLHLAGWSATLLVRRAMAVRAGATGLV